MIEILPASLDNLDAVMAIENVSFVFPKSRQLIASELEQNISRFYLARRQGSIVGFIIFWVVADEIQLIDVAVGPQCRRQKIGSKLFQLMTDYGKRHGAKTIHLEVRSGNLEAIEFYRRAGFVEVGLRKRYYSNGEDALLMKLCIQS